MRLVPVDRLVAVAATGGQGGSPAGIDQVSLAVFDAVNNALRVNAALSSGGVHTPTDANQVFTSIYDRTNNAVRVNCIVGCSGTGGTSFVAAGDLIGSSSSQTVVGLQGKPISSSGPTSGQVLTWTGTQWSPATPATGGTGAGTGACLANQFVTAVNSSAVPTCAQPSFANLSGTIGPVQLPGATSSQQGAIVLTQDLTGSASTPKVQGLQGNPVAPTAPTTGQALIWSGSAWAPTTPPSGGTGAPGGTNTAVQFNNSSAFGGDATNFSYNSTTHALTVTGTITASSFTTTGAGAGYTTWTTGSMPASATGQVTCGANTGNFFSCSDAGGTVTPVAFLAGDLAGTQGSEQVGGLHLASEGLLQSQPLTETVANDTTTGTHQFGTAKLTSTGAIDAATGDTTVRVLPVVSATATTGNARLAVSGQALCTMDVTASSTEGHYVVESTTAAHECHDAGASMPTSGWVIGQLISNSTTAGATASVNVHGWSAASGGGAGAVLLAPTASQTIQPTSGNNVTPLALAPASGTTQTADLFDVWKDSGLTTKAFWVDASGNLNFLGNNATYGATGQATQSFWRSFGATISNSFAPPYLDMEKVDGSVKSFFAPSTSQGGQFCGTSATPAADCPAGSVFLQNPMTTAGDLIVGGSLVGQIAAPAAPSLSTATTGGSIPASTVVDVVITYFNGGQTTGSSQATITTGAGSTNTVTVPAPANSGNAYDFKIYACTGASCTNYGLQGSADALGANVTLTSISTGGAAPPTSNTTAMYSAPTRLPLGTNGQVLTSNGTTVVWAGGATGFFISETASRSTGYAPISGSARLTSIYLPQAITATHIDFNVVTTDTVGGDLYDVGLYSGCTNGASATLVADTGAMAFSTANLNDVAIKQGTVTLQPGWYCWAFAGNATTAQIGGDLTSSNYLLRFNVNQAVTATITGGALPSSITAPGDSWQVGGMDWFALRQ